MKEQNDNSKHAIHDYVTAAIAEDIDMANEYRDILAKNNIPAVATTQKSYSSDAIGFAVMVPESCLEEAQEIIESEQSFDSFLDDAFNDPDNWDYEKGFDNPEENNDFEDENY
jgi:adenine specific DNA methylase Mod